MRHRTPQVAGSPCHLLTGTLQRGFIGFHRGFGPAGRWGPPQNLDATVFVGEALDEAFALEGVETIEGGFIRGDLAAGLDFSDERGLPMLADIAQDEVADRLLLAGEGPLGQSELRGYKRRVMEAYCLSKILP